MASMLQYISDRLPPQPLRGSSGNVGMNQDVNNKEQRANGVPAKFLYQHDGGSRSIADTSDSRARRKNAYCDTSLKVIR